MENNLTAILNKHITLGIEAIYSTMISGQSPEAVSFHHILNRIMIVAQIPINFVVFERVNGKWIDRFQSNIHPRHKNIIKDVCNKVKDDQLISLWGSKKYSLLVLIADYMYEFPVLEKIENIKDVSTILNAASYKIIQILKKENYSGYVNHNKNSSFTEYLISSVDECVRVQINKKTTKKISADYLEYKNTKNSKIEQNIFNDIDRKLLKNTTNYFLTGTGIIDKVFKKVSRNLIALSGSSNNPLKITNFILFARDYGHNDEKYLRHEEYDYRLRAIMCSQQEKELNDHLRYLLKHHKDMEYANTIDKSRKTIYEKQIEKLIDKDEQAASLALSASNIIWDKLGINKNEPCAEGIKYLVTLFGSHYGSTTRSMADPVFYGINFFRAPFDEDAGMRRCFVNGYIPDDFNLHNLSDDNSQKKDILRAVMFQYLVESMVSEYADDIDDIDDIKLTLQLSPIELGGRVWGVATYAARTSDPTSALDTPDRLSRFNMFWLQNYHFQRDITDRLKKNLRTHMNDFYVESVATCYVKWVNDINRSKVRFSEAIEKINSVFKGLSCYFPYDMVSIEICAPSTLGSPMPTMRNNYNDDGKNEAAFGLKRVAKVSIIPSSCFPRPHGAGEKYMNFKFVSPISVAIKMSDALFIHIDESFVQGLEKNHAESVSDRKHIESRGH